MYRRTATVLELPDRSYVAQNCPKYSKRIYMIGSPTKKLIANMRCNSSPTVPQGCRIRLSSKSTAPSPSSAKSTVAGGWQSGTT